MAKVLEDRQKVYGEFLNIAEISQKFKEIIYLYNSADLTNYEMEALEMILHKIARILTPAENDVHYIDNWKDIAGYAELVVDSLNKDKEVLKIDSKVKYNKFN
jgi:hypothetical protein